MASSLLVCSSCICSIFLIVINVLAMFVAALLLLLGVLLLWGYQLVSAVNPSALSMLDSISEQLNSAFGTSSIDTRQLMTNIASLTMPAGAACLALGLVVMVTACLGCCPASCCRRNRKKPLIAYIAVVILIFAIQCIALLYTFTNGAQLKQWTKTGMKTGLLAKFTGIDCSNLESLLVNLMQIFVGCCGVTNGTDFYSLSSRWQREYTAKSNSGNFTYNMTYPISCCKFNLTSMEQYDSFCSYNNTNPTTSWYRTGCHDKLVAMLESMLDFKAVVIGIVCVLLTQLLLVLGAAIILRAPKTGKSSKVAPAPEPPGSQR